jgi:hypothetical protein
MAQARYGGVWHLAEMSIASAMSASGMLFEAETTFTSFHGISFLKIRIIENAFKALLQSGARSGH